MTRAAESRMNKFIIIGTQRTGSSALAEGIGLHPNVVCGWEWTLNCVPWRAIQIAEQGLNGKFESLREIDRRHMNESAIGPRTRLGFRKLFRSSNKWIIAPQFAPALLYDGLLSHIEWLRRRPEIKIIHIVRENNLEWLKSKALAHSSKIFVRDTYPDKLVVGIQINQALKRVASKIWLDNCLRTLKNSNPYLLIKYEEFLYSNDTIIMKALEFLDEDSSLLPAARSQMRIHPQSAGSTRERISNYDEIELALCKRGILTSNFDEMELDRRVAST